MNAKKIKKYDMESLWFTDFAGEPERCWFAAGNVNGFFEANLITGEANFLGRFPGEKTWKKKLYQCCAKYRNKILFAPSTASSIAIYDIRSGALNKIILPDSLQIDDTKILFIVQYDNLCFLIGSAKPVIICVDLSNYHISYDFDFLNRKKLTKSYGLIDERHIWNRDFIKREDYFILISYKLGFYLKYDINTRKAEQFELSVGRSESAVIAARDNIYVYLSGKRTISYVKNNIRKDFLIRKDIYKKFKRFTESYFIGEDYYVFTDSNIIIKFEFNNGCIKYFEIPEYQSEFIIEGKKGFFFRCIKSYGDEWFLMHRDGNLLVKYNHEFVELTRQRILPHNVNMFHLSYKRYYNSNMVNEDSVCPFLDIEYFPQLIEEEKGGGLKESRKEHIGKKIYKYIKAEGEEHEERIGD